MLAHLAGIPISIHAPREGSDQQTTKSRTPQPNFYPRSPRGERRLARGAGIASQYFYPRSPRGERRIEPRQLYNIACISIHAPREGSDLSPAASWYQFSIFLSTLPARGATICYGISFRRVLISIHAPREGSDGTVLVRGGGRREISIHAPREGSDVSAFAGFASKLISIHAPREGSDPAHGGRSALGRAYFYPRSPRGERPATRWWASSIWTFLSTLPARGATRLLLLDLGQVVISIHAPREGSDPRRCRSPG